MLPDPALNPSLDRLDPALRPAAAAAAALLGGPIEAIDRIRGAGRNSGVFRICCRGRNYALKQYPPRPAGERDRATIELAALRFMTDHGIACVPLPYAADAERGYALIEWIDGDAVLAPTSADIDAAIGFLAAVHRLRDEPQALALPEAAEACLSGTEIVRQLERRLARLDAVPEEPELATFISGTVRPLVAEIVGWVEAGYRELGLSFGAPIEPSKRSLCPADFGFHNAMRRPSDELAFIDFDYFGWDDPVKLTSDVLLHPGMQLSEELKQRFAAACCGLYGADTSFSARLGLLYPLFGLRWCLILLNEFLPERWAHRLNAGGAAPGAAGMADWAAAKQGQLDRAREWVQLIATNFRWFPYGK